METKTLDSWEKFEEKLEFPSETDTLRKRFTEGMTNQCIYRGQNNAEWPLQTTLQRLSDSIRHDFVFADYLKGVVGLADSIDSLMDSTWKLSLSDIVNVNSYDNLIGNGKNLRHCGFPSPLLDWTESPYIAAFFAFCDIPKGTDKVAIYSYCEMPKKAKHINVSAPSIRVIDCSLKTHKRHYLQQTQYTLCLKACGATEGFGTYEEAFKASENYNGFDNGNHRHDVLVKYELPATERKKVLRKLDKMNISYVSLFQGEDYLLKTLALRHFEWVFA